MTALEHFYNGCLREAIEVQQRLVHKAAMDPADCLLLAELLLFDGRFDAIREQLDRLPQDQPGMKNYLQAYCALLTAETKRQQMAAEEDPAFLLEVPEALTFRLNALEEIHDGGYAAASEWLDEADAATPQIRGHIDGREFDFVRDTDEVFGPVLEVLIDDQYAWFPMQQIRRLRLGRIESLRDLYFVPGWLTAKTGEEWHIHLPALYPRTFQHHNDALRTGQDTDWHADTDGPVRGIGMRLFSFGDEELSLRDFTQWEG